MTLPRKEKIMKEVIDVYGAAFNAVIKCPASVGAKMIGITSILSQLSSDIDEACITLVRSEEDPMELLERINCVTGLIVDYYESLLQPAKHNKILVTAITCSLLAVRSLLKDSKETCLLLYCTQPVRIIRLQESLASFESLYNAMPETLKRFTEFGTQKDAQGFINALKRDVTELHESGDVDDSEGFHRLMGVLNAQNN